MMGFTVPASDASTDDGSALRKQTGRQCKIKGV